MNWQRARNEFESHLTLERGLSENTIKAYLRDLKHLSEAAEEKGILPLNLKSATLEDLIEARHKQGANKRSIARMISSWKAFFAYLTLERVIDNDPSALLETPKSDLYLPEVLDIQEVDAMISKIRLDKTEGHRDKAIIEMLYGCGLRVSELTGLTMNDLHLDEGFITVFGKGNKQRLVPIHDEAIRQIKLYIKESRVHYPVKLESKHLVFLNLRGGGISRVSVFKLVKKLAELCGIQKNVSPHTFRHSFATHLVQNGADLRVVQEMLGHESILTTEIYTHLDRAHLREEWIQHHPRAQRPG